MHVLMSQVGEDSLSNGIDRTRRCIRVVLSDRCLHIKFEIDQIVVSALRSLSQSTPEKMAHSQANSSQHQKSDRVA